MNGWVYLFRFLHKSCVLSQEFLMNIFQLNFVIKWSWWHQTMTNFQQQQFAKVTSPYGCSHEKKICNRYTCSHTKFLWFSALCSVWPELPYTLHNVGHKTLHGIIARCCFATLCEFKATFNILRYVHVSVCPECLGGVQGDGPAVPGGGPAAGQLTLRGPGAVADHRSNVHHHTGSSLDQRLPLPARK